jgi:DegV family protein with EDD domain
VPSGQRPQRIGKLKIVTDSGTDLNLTSEQKAELDIHIIPLTVTLDGKTYHDGVDIEAKEFYQLLASTTSSPKTSQPSVGEFVEMYERLAVEDKDILSIHISSGLSGAFTAAQAAAKMVPEANITQIDTKTLSVAAGWQVEAAARAIKAGWIKEKILSLIETISNKTESIYTLKELKYLIHGGRINHLKGLFASILDIKPLIGVEKIKGTYVQRGQLRTFQRAIEGLVDLITRQNAPQSTMRVQVCHSFNPEGAATLRNLISKRFDCTWLPDKILSIVLGAHTGPSMVGVAYAPVMAFPEIR